MKKKAKVYMLPTEQKSLLVTCDCPVHKGQLVFDKQMLQEKTVHYNPQHLYFTSDEEIKKGDWCIGEDEGGVNVHQCKIVHNCKAIGCKKIIATTNPELWATKDVLSIVQRKGLTNHYPIEKPTGIGRIGDDFVEAYIKAYNEGHPITEVMLEYEEEVNERLSEHPLSCKFGEVVYKQTLKLRSNGTVIIFPVVEKMYSKQEIITKLSEFTDHAPASYVKREFTKWLE